MDALNKYRIIEKIIETNDELLLEEINLLLGIDKESNDLWNTIPEKVKETINASMEELKEGKVLSNEEVINDIKKRFIKDF
jgi:hypothetical protein